MIQSFVNADVFYGENILRLFDNADFILITFIVMADGAEVGIGNIETRGAEPGFLSQG
jgi:hypothetical protein